MRRFLPAALPAASVLACIGPAAAAQDSYCLQGRQWGYQAIVSSRATTNAWLPHRAPTLIADKSNGDLHAATVRPCPQNRTARRVTSYEHYDLENQSLLAPKINHCWHPDSRDCAINLSQVWGCRGRDPNGFSWVALTATGFDWTTRRPIRSGRLYALGPLLLNPAVYT